MRGIKIPQQEFALKMQGGLCAGGGLVGVFAGHYGMLLSELISQLPTCMNRSCIFTGISLISELIRYYTLAQKLATTSLTVRPHWACMGICKIHHFRDQIHFHVFVMYTDQFYLYVILHVLLTLYFSQLTPPSSPVFTRSQTKYVHVTIHLCTLTDRQEHR